MREKREKEKQINKNDKEKEKIRGREEKRGTDKNEIINDLNQNIKKREV